MRIVGGETVKCTEIYQLAKAHPEGINSDMVIKADPREYYTDVTGKINAMIDEGLLMCVWEGPKLRIIPNPDYNGKYCESYGIERRAEIPKQAHVSMNREPQRTLEAFL